ETPLPAELQGEHLLIDGATVSATNLILASLTLSNGAVLTHPPTELATERRLELLATNLVIDASSRIDLSTRGYLGGLTGPNFNSQAGRTLGNTATDASTRRN